MKRVLTVVAIAALAVTLIGCSSNQANEQSSASQSTQPQEEQTATKDFDGSGMADTGEGIMYISTAGGTSEDGKIPEIVGSGMLQIGINTQDMDGSVCTVYIDGMENIKLNAGAITQQTITLEGSDLKQGTHTVELVKLDDADTPVIYKVAKYKVA